MKILWFVSSLEQKGGGERFVLESVKAIKAQGCDIIIVCDRLSNLASFDGLYDLSNVVCIKKDSNDSAYLMRVWGKLNGILGLYQIISKTAPDLVVCQSEFDAIKLFIISRFKRFSYRVFVFGQMYQFKTDITRYSSVFIKNLETIVKSRPGYSSTVLIPPPKLSPIIWVVNELISRLKYVAINKSDKVFTLSSQVRWEVLLNYNVDAIVCRAAFDETYIDRKRIVSKVQISNPLRILSVCRLVEKKRVDIIIKAFSMFSLPSQLRIVGVGPEEVQLKKLAISTHRAQDIAFLGAVDDSTVQNELANADCFVSMDVGDYDISVVEAMGKGLRVIVSKDFDLSDFGASFSGVQQVEPNPEALADAFQNIQNVPGPGLNNLEVLEKITWQSLARTVVS